MGNKDYRKFSENSNNNPVINTEELGQNIIPTPAPTVEPTPAPTVEPTPAPTVEPTVKNVEGMVVNCTRLNVRKEPNKNAKVIRILDKGNCVMIDLENSTEDFYKVSTPSGEGYCMKNFIEVK